MGAVKIDSSTKLYNVDLEEALEHTGFGKFNVGMLLFCAFMMVGMILETMGFSFIVPASQCDFELGVELKGWVASLPFMGFILTSHVWGFVADTYGRKRAMLISCAVGSIISVLSSLSPNVKIFIILRLLASLFIAGGAALGYAMVGEFNPVPYRDRMILFANASVTFGTGLGAAIAWILLPLDFTFPFWAMDYRPWRMVIIANAFPFVMCSIILPWIPESPKFLLSVGKHEEALKVLKSMFRINTGLSSDRYVVETMAAEKDAGERKGSIYDMVLKTIEIFRPPWLIKTLLLSSMQFVIFGIANGLGIWIPDVVNKVLNGSPVDQSTVCKYLSNTNATNDSAKFTFDPLNCNDSLSTESFAISISLAFTITVLTCLTTLLMPTLGRRRLLYGSLFFSAVTAVLVPLVPNIYASLALLCSTFVICPCIGYVGAFTVQLFPTNKRAMAICMTMMIGRIGSLVDTKLLATGFVYFCDSTFYIVGALCLLAGLASFTLPADGETAKTPDSVS